MMMLMLAACVQPIQPTPVPTPTTPPTPTPPAPPVSGATFPPEAISAWFAQNFGVVTNNMTLFTQLQVGPDDVVGFSFQDAAGQPCAGFALTTAATATVWNGDYRCAPPGTPVIAAPLLFALTNNEFYVVTYGVVDPNLVPNGGGVSAVYANGSSVNQQLAGSGFVMLRQGLEFPTRLVVIGPNESTIADVPLQ